MSASASQALEYLQQLQGATLKKLYQQPSAVLAIFRCMLPQMAKNIVMAMLYMPHPFLIADLEAWIKPEAKSIKDRAISALESLHLITTVSETPKNPAYRLTTAFATSLRHALEGTGNHRSFGVACTTPDKHKVSVEFLDGHAKKQWESIIYYMVGSTSGLANAESLGAGVSEGTKKLLKQGGFVRPDRGKVHITQSGFTFILREVNAQVWSLLIVYLKHSQDLMMSEIDILSFLFMLGSLELGRDYSTDTLSSTQVVMLEDLSAFGIVYRPSKDSDRYYPTRLATTLTSDATALSMTSEHVSTDLNSVAKNSKGYIIVETNYRIYAYTSSLLQIAVLSLFARLTTRFPNLVSGKLTRESIRRANELGISAAQIIDYLASHAHPQMQKNNPVLPPTVMDQIRLWEYEGERVECTEGYLMKEFVSEAEYQEVLAYAESLGVLVWKNDAKKILFVDRIEQIGQFLQKRHKSKQPNT